MRNQKITVLSENFVYKLRYMLLQSKNSSVIHIQADKYDKKSFLLDERSPCLCTETNFKSLPHTTTTFKEAENLFSEIIRNHIFPIYLDYIGKSDTPFFRINSNYKIRINSIKEYQVR